MLNLQKKVLEFTWENEVQRINFPSVLKLEQLNIDLKNTDKSVKVTIDFLISLGLKEEIAQQLEESHFETILNELRSDKKK